MNTRRWFNGTGLVLLLLGFLAFAVLNNLLLRGARLDLTENHLYTLSQGTRHLVSDIREPVNLYFYFSETTTKDYPELRSYAQRVRELLQQYVADSGGKLRLNVIDPQPFSEEEDRAAQSGLQAVPLGNSGNEAYFGLVGTNSVDAKEIIAFFQPNKEALLEYDISKLIYRLSHPKKPTVGLVQGMPMIGGFNYLNQENRPAWAVVDELRQFFNVRELKTDSARIPDDIDVLMVVQPKSLSAEFRYAIDQYVMKGGKTLFFVDPVAEQDRMPSSDSNPFPQRFHADDLNDLFKAWGFHVVLDKVVADPQHALQVTTGAGGVPITHLALLGLGPDSRSDKDVVTAGLDTINISTAGIVEPEKGASTHFESLLHTSNISGTLPVSAFDVLPDPSVLQRQFTPVNQAMTIAARISGPATSAFPQGAPAATSQTGAAPAKPDGDFRKTGNIQVMVFADTDLLSDRLWVQTQNFFGQTLSNAFADNGDLVANAIDNLAGDADLISIRGRGHSSRPFERIQQLRAQAETQLQAKADELQKQLDETEQKLSALQHSDKPGVLTLSPQQQAALQSFVEEKARIRKELREVRHQLDKNIESLENRLKLLNIAFVPLVLSGIALAVAAARRSRRRRSVRTA